MWPRERLIAYLFSSATALLSLSTASLTPHSPLSARLWPTPPHPPHSSTTCRTAPFKDKSHQRSSSVEQQSWSRLCIHQGSWATILRCQKEHSNSVTMQRKGPPFTLLALGREPHNLLGTDHSVSLTPYFKNCQVLKAGIECLVRYIILFSHQRVPDLNVTNFRPFYWGKHVPLLVFGQHLERLFSQEKTRALSVCSNTSAMYGPNKDL